MKKILTIAGSDCSGGAGIQADIKTIMAHKMYAMSAITALTAQNTLGVFGVEEVSPSFVAQQIDVIFSDITPDAVKIGMVSSSKIINTIVEKLKEHNAKNIVVDPVMISTSGSKLLSDEAIDALITKLIPLADVITPNIAEAQVLANMEIKTTDDMVVAAKKIANMLKGSVIIKGGHLEDSADDLIFINGNAVWVKGTRVENKNNHGTGCTLSSAIACNLAHGNDVIQSVVNSKEYVTGALKDNMDLGKGSGPLNHAYKISG